MEVSTADGKKSLSSGQATIIPVRQEHTHRYLPQSHILAFQLRPADRPPGDLHQGSRLFFSENPLEVRAQLNYLRIREFTVAPGARMPESVTVEPNFGYVVEGTLTARLEVRPKTLKNGRRHQISNVVLAGNSANLDLPAGLLGNGVSSTEAGKAFTIPLNVRHVESNEGAAPLRFILVDLHP